jgi:hypothetical protein
LAACSVAGLTFVAIEPIPATTYRGDPYAADEDSLHVYRWALERGYPRLNVESLWSRGMGFGKTNDYVNFVAQGCAQTTFPSTSSGSPTYLPNIDGPGEKLFRDCAYRPPGSLAGDDVSSNDSGAEHFVWLDGEWWYLGRGPHQAGITWAQHHDEFLSALGLHGGAVGGGTQ